MAKNTQTPASNLFQSAGGGDQQALDSAWQQLYQQLHQIASQQMSRESNGHLLQTTAVVHEAWFRLSDQNRSDWQDQQSFLAAAAVTMRRVLIDCARKENAQKRGGNDRNVTLEESSIISSNDQQRTAIEVHDALESLASFAPMESQALELMIFGGMTGEQAAEALDVSASTIDRKIRVAKAWLSRELSEQ